MGSKKPYDTEARINQVLALVVDMNPEDLDLVINRLRNENFQKKKDKGADPYTDTIQT